MSSFLQDTWDLLLKSGMLIAGFFSGMFSGDNSAIVLLLVLMVADYISGVVAAFLRKSPHSPNGGLDSSAGARGLLRKGLMLLVVTVAYALDHFVGQGTAMFESAATWFYISNEGISLVENLALCGVPIPKRLRLALERLNETAQEDAAQEAAKTPAQERPVPPAEPAATPPEPSANDHFPDDPSQNG